MPTSGALVRCSSSEHHTVTRSPSLTARVSLLRPSVRPACMHVMQTILVLSLSTVAAVVSGYLTLSAEAVERSDAPRYFAVPSDIARAARHSMQATNLAVSVLGLTHQSAVPQLDLKRDGWMAMMEL